MGDTTFSQSQHIDEAILCALLTTGHSSDLVRLGVPSLLSGSEDAITVSERSSTARKLFNVAGAGSAAASMKLQLEECWPRVRKKANARGTSHALLSERRQIARC